MSQGCNARRSRESGITGVQMRAFPGGLVFTVVSAHRFPGVWCHRGADARRSLGSGVTDGGCCCCPIPSITSNVSSVIIRGQT